MFLFWSFLLGSPWYNLHGGPGAKDTHLFIYLLDTSMLRKLVLFTASFVNWFGLSADFVWSDQMTAAGVQVGLCSWDKEKTKKSDNAGRLSTRHRGAGQDFWTCSQGPGWDHCRPRFMLMLSWRHQRSCSCPLCDLCESDVYCQCVIFAVSS